MSTNFSKTEAATSQDETVTLTQYCGPQAERRCQVTAGTRCLSMSQEQAREVAMNLLLWANGMPAEEV